MKNYEYILFDLDGTLTDPQEGITKCVQYALEFYGYEVPTAEELICFIGPPLEDSFVKYFGMTREQSQAAMAKYRERFGPIGLYENKRYEGIKELLRDLKKQGKKVALATSKPTKFAKTIIEHFEIAEYFDVIYGSEFDGTRFTKTEVMVDVLKEFGLSTEEELAKAVMVGDRKYDVEGAKNCGIDSIGVEYGFALEGELKEAGATYIFNTVSELADFLLLHK